MTAEDLAHRARALAQAHPLSPLARRYHQRVVTEEGASQPLPEIGIWAGTALLTGYCLRRVEESEAGLALEPVAQEPGPDDDDRPFDATAALADLEEGAARIASDVRQGVGGHVLGDDDEVVAALDRIIASEVSKRLDNWKDSFDEAAWAEFEEYLTWWVVKGYALRAAEMASGAVA